MSAVTGIILAGGKSLRLGHAKALERINNSTLIERVVDCLSPVCQEILVVTSQEMLGLMSAVRLKAKVVADVYPGGGALGGIYTGLINANTFYGLVVACDMPFLNRALLCYLVGLASDFDAVVPRINGLVEPLHAIYSENCLTSIEKLLHQGKLGVHHIFDSVEARYVCEDEISKFDPGHLSFFNINTKDDLRKARALIRQRDALKQ